MRAQNRANAANFGVYDASVLGERAFSSKERAVRSRGSALACRPTTVAARESRGSVGGCAQATPASGGCHEVRKTPDNQAERCRPLEAKRTNRRRAP